MGLLGTDRGNNNSAAKRSAKNCGSAVCVFSLRGLQGRVPGKDRFSSFVIFYFLLSLRQKVVEETKGRANLPGFMEKIAFQVWSFVFSKPFYYSLTGRMMVFLQYFYQKDNELRGLPYPFSKWTKEKNFPAFSRKPFRKRWKEKYHGKNGVLR